MKSIRRNLLFALLAALCAAMLVGAWATYRAARDEAGELFDYHLKQIALSLRDQHFQGSAETLAGDERLDYLIRVWNESGLTVFYSQPHDEMPELTRLGYSTTGTAEGTWRLYAIQYHGQTIAVAQPMRVRDRLAATAALRTLKPFFVLLPVLGLLIWWLVGRGLRPLGQLAQSVQTRGADSLTPLAEAGVPDEARPLVTALNDLLARLKSSIDVQRAFVADAAHELRTPLAALQLQTRLVERAVSDDERKLAIDDLKAGLQRATHTVQQLLTLARQEPGAVEANPVEIDLESLLRESVAEHAGLALARNIDLGLLETGESVRLVGDPVALRVLLANLIANALHYIPEGGRVDVAYGIDEGSPYLEVSDDGPGIPAGEREHVFDRFYRRGSGSGAGLGLAIVQTVAQRHGATVSLSDALAGGLRVRVMFPAGRIVAP